MSARASHRLVRRTRAGYGREMQYHPKKTSRHRLHTREVIGQTAPRHTSAEFVTFLGEVVASQTEDREIHIILDNLSAHKTPRPRVYCNSTRMWPYTSRQPILPG